MSMVHSPTLDLMKQVNRQFVTGVTVVTAMDDGHPARAGRQRVRQHLAGPADRDGLRTAHLVDARLPVPRQPPGDQHPVHRPGRRRQPVRHQDRRQVRGAGLEPGPFGSPLIERSSAQMEVEIRERLQASTHTLFICRVVHADVTDRHPWSTAPGGSSTAAHSTAGMISRGGRTVKKRTGRVTARSRAGDSEMRRRIIGGEIEPGEPHLRVCPNRGVRRQPYPGREAFKQLQTEGLVEIRPRVGTFVDHPSRREITELFEMKELLEGAAARCWPSEVECPRSTSWRENLRQADACRAPTTPGPLRRTGPGVPRPADPPAPTTASSRRTTGC